MDSYCVVCSVITYVAAQLIHFLYIFSMAARFMFTRWGGRQFSGDGFGIEWELYKDGRRWN